ncbi:hypothetical protein IWQ62_001817 [Dispira parvispora]|uniref:Uncharacterized protein n=1 Tax=Dispira parvispora TaxID=1520584 RepID=A0A9W8E8N5_9FUNG|nr:hypothetical protein IWQ62_001817 [Dispira parvispora]
MFQRFQNFVNNAVEIIAPQIQTGEEQLLEHWLGICDVYRAEQRHVLDASVYVTRIPDHLQGIVKCVKAEEIHRRKAVHENQDILPQTPTLPRKKPSGLYSTRTSVSSSSTLHPTDPTTGIKDGFVLPKPSTTTLVSDLYIGPCLEAISAHRILCKLVNFAEADRPRGMRLEVIKFFIQFLNVTSSKCIPDSTVRQPLLRLLRSVYVIIMNPRPMETVSSPLAGSGNFATLSYGNASRVQLDHTNASLKQENGGRSNLRRGATIGPGMGKNRARPSLWTAFDPPVSSTSRNMSPTVEYLAQTASWDNAPQELSPLAPLRKYDGTVDLKRRATLSHRDVNRRHPLNQKTEASRLGNTSHHSGPTIVSQESLTHQFMILVHTLLKHICRQPEMLDLMVDWGTVNPAELSLIPVDSTSVGGSAGWSAHESTSPMGQEPTDPALAGTTVTSRSSGTSSTTTARIIVSVPQPDGTQRTSATPVDAKPSAQAPLGHRGRVDSGSEAHNHPRPLLAISTNEARSETLHNRRDPQCFLLDVVLKFLQEPGVVGHLSREGMILALETVVMDPRLTWLLLHHVKFIDTLTEHLSYLYAMMPYHKYATETRHDSNIPTALEMESTTLPVISASKELGNQTVRHMHTLKASAKVMLANIFNDDEYADMPSSEGGKSYGQGVNGTVPPRDSANGLQGTKDNLTESDLDQESSQPTSRAKGQQAVSAFFHFWRLVDQLAIICESHPQVMVPVQNNIVHAFLKPTLVMAITSSTEGLAYTATQYATELVRSTRCALLLESIFYALLGEDLNPELSPQQIATESRIPDQSTKLTIQTDTKALGQSSEDTSATPQTPLDNDAFLASALNISMDTLSMSAIAEDWMKSVSLTQDGVDSEVGRASSYLHDVHKPVSPSVRDLLMDRLVSPNERLRIATLQLFDSMLDTYHQFVYISLVLRNFMTPGSSSSGAVTPLSRWRGSPPLSGPGSLSRQSSSGASVSSDPRSYSPQWPEWDEAIRSRLEKQANDNCMKNAIVERFLSLLPDTVMGDAPLDACDPSPSTPTAQSHPETPLKRHSPYPPVSALEQGQEDYVMEAQTKAYAVQRAKSTWLPWETLVLRVAQYDPLTASVSPAVTSSTSPASPRLGNDGSTLGTRLRSHSQVQDEANVDGDLQAQINDLRSRALSDTHLTMEPSSITNRLHTTTALTNPTRASGGSGATEDLAKYSRTLADHCSHPIATTTVDGRDEPVSSRTSQYVYPGVFLTALLTLLSQHLQQHMVHNLLVTGLLAKIVALDEPAINWYMFCACHALDHRLSHLATETSSVSVPSPDSFSPKGDNQQVDPFVTSRAPTGISTLRGYNQQNANPPNTAYLYDTLAQVASEAHQLAQTIPHFGHRLQLARQQGFEPQKLAHSHTVDASSGRLHPTVRQSTMLASARSNAVTSQTLDESETTDELGAMPSYVTVDDGTVTETSTKDTDPGGETSPPVLTTSVKRFVNAYIVLQEFCKEVAAIALVNHFE